MASKAAKLKKEQEKVAEARDTGMSALMGLLTGKQGIRKKEASEVGKKKVNYFRGKDFAAFFRDNEKLVTKKCPKLMATVFKDGYPEDEAGLDKLGNLLLHFDFVQCANRDDTNFSEIKKWPDRLVACTGSFDVDSQSYYIVRWEGSKTMQHIMMTFLLIFVLICFMWQAWPIWAKVGVWYCTFAFCAFFFVVLVVRLVAYVLFWCVGCEFWILPNLDDADLGLLDSLKPLWSFERRRDGYFMLVMRLVAMGIAGASSWQIAQTYTFNDGAEVDYIFFFEFLIIFCTYFVNIFEFSKKNIIEKIHSKSKRNQISNFV